MMPWVGRRGWEQVVLEDTADTAVAYGRYGVSTVRRYWSLYICGLDFYPMDEKPQIPEAQATQIREFVFAGRKIEAIKLLRQSTGLQLLDAKTVIEKLEAELRQASPEKFT